MTVGPGKFNSTNDGLPTVAVVVLVGFRVVRVVVTDLQG